MFIKRLVAWLLVFGFLTGLAWSGVQSAQDAPEAERPVAVIGDLGESEFGPKCCDFMKPCCPKGPCCPKK
jgi:hypothetical protein